MRKNKIIYKGVNFLRKTLYQERKINKNTLIYFSFFVGVSLFWLLNKLTYNYEIRVKYPIEYYNFPKDKILKSTLPVDILINIESTGFYLLRFKLFHKIQPLKIDVNSFVTKTQSTPTPITFSNILHSLFKKEVNFKLEVKRTSPNTIYLEFAKMAEKKIPIIPKIYIKLEQQLMITNKKLLIPDSLTIYGNKEDIDKIDRLSTEERNFINIDGNFQSLLLIQPLTGITFSQDTVTLNVEVERFTEHSMTFPIQVINLTDSDSIQLKIFPDSVEAIFNVPISIYNSIRKDDFKFVVDYLQIDENNNHLLDIMLEDRPYPTQNIHYYPENVEYLLINTSVSN